MAKPVPSIDGLPIAVCVSTDLRSGRVSLGIDLFPNSVTSRRTKPPYHHIPVMIVGAPPNIN